MPEAIPPPVLCSTARLARSLRTAHHDAQRKAGFSQWQPLPTLTLNQWLDGVLEQALLQGHIPLEETPRLALNQAQELELWKRVIERVLTGEWTALFDLSGLARAAMNANRLMQEWNIPVPDNGFGLAEEVSQFLLWRTEFRRQCEAEGWLEKRAIWIGRSPNSARLPQPCRQKSLLPVSTASAPRSSACSMPSKTGESASSAGSICLILNPP